MPRHLRLFRLGFLIFLRNHPALRPYWRETVWGQKPSPAESVDMTELRRGVYPLIDIGLLMSAIGGIFASVPALSELYANWFVDLLCITLALCASGAFFGVTVPRFWPIEVVSKALIFGGLGLYELALLFIVTGLLPAPNPENRLYLLGVVFAFIVVIAWRLFKLIPVWAASIKAKWARDLILDEER